MIGRAVLVLIKAMNDRIKARLEMDSASGKATARDGFRTPSFRFLSCSKARQAFYSVGLL